MSINEKLLKEELKKHKLLYEYDFFDARDDEEDVVLGEVPDDEPVPDDSEETDGLDIGDDLDGDKSKEDDSEDVVDFDDDPIDLDDSGDDDLGDDDLGDEPMEPAEDEVEVDVTELVKDSEETRNIANSANQKMDLLMNKFGELEGSLTKMDSITKKIDNMEIELDKRMPSEEEKLEMRSLDSYPYSLKLTDYWSEKDGKYDVMDKNKDMVLTQQDVEDDFNSSSVENSFNDYDEEDIPVQ